MIELTIPSLIGGAAALWVLSSPRVAEIFYRLALFEPHKFPRGDWSMDWLGKIELQEILVEGAEKHLLHGWLLQQPGSVATVMVNHGNTGNIADLRVLIQLLLQCKIDLFVYDYRGYGKSTSSPSVAGLCKDGLSVFDWLRRAVNNPIVIYGESLGGAVSCYVAQRRECAGLILQSAFSHLRQVACETYPIFAIWPQFLFPRPYYHNAKMLASFTKPVLIVHGTNDTEVKYAHAEELYAAAQEPKRLVTLPHTNHSDIAANDADLFMSEIKQFVKEAVANAPQPVRSTQEQIHVAHA